MLCMICYRLCREHGRQLSDLMATNNKDDATLMKKFDMFGIVKEIEVDDEGLSVFYNDHFTYPLYKDDDLVVYNDFFGKRKLKLTTYNPITLYKGYKAMNKRLKSKKLDGNLTGEGKKKGFFC